ncbi:ATP-dependent RNA helicase [Bombilactobacillus mellis]|uniref:DEAD-box ATP-dependent RNA helicase CshA n=1 Tax=Bombilactobacillus mellis TaxID=1218508 RepID=A0A0F4KZ72_9LACO|nr:DEAD/DEAH box helicase [Bombilactobacillus mellis]KJY51259.1 ATP-dependent RNA helicase [Bombilactobacillus mellis]MCT6841048.1 DEAD/DEAH box helicase [Bombilactobacillus mellis]MCT6856798.1 DEAD/DEAH box helicase [Bombilactobacillus mellis]MCT6872770.1 DEAD/DEAH box helicase [Bombilactobacillus mellis]MCX0279211.1 DEAD/DEAH box helicase [Bombilactobacillus mellis]
MKFNELNLDDSLLSAIAEAGFNEATPIQAQTIPLVLSGVDVIGQAQTGTGKTASFGLPILQEIDVQNPHIQALIISPTRELAVQTQEELQRLGKYRHAKVIAVYGGSDIRRQIKQLREHPQVVVGTPGRLLDHLKRHTLKLEAVQRVVLDEADEMLDMGFVEDIENILENVPSQHQTLLYSATMPKPIMRIAEKFMQQPQIVKIKSKELTADKIEQYMVRSKEYEKFNIMTRLFDVQKPELALIFGRTKRRVDELTRGLKARGYNAEGIHGDLSQQKRMSVLRQFKAEKLNYLVATDVAARGLDISGVSHVYNYDIPQDPDSYVHRIGRTGRAGRSGVSVTFVAPNEMSYLRSIEQLTNVRMLPLKPPTDAEALAGQIDTAKLEITRQVENDKLDKFANAAQELLDEYDPLTLAQLLLKNLSKDPEAIPVKITPERPLPSRRSHDNRSGNRYRSRRSGHRDYHFENRRGRSRHDQNHFNHRQNKRHSYNIRTQG